MNKIQAVSVWQYAHHPADTEVNFHRQGDKIGSYYRVTPSSRLRLGKILRSHQLSVGIGAAYTHMYYAVKEQS